jgi:uncharacterized protein
MSEAYTALSLTYDVPMRNLLHHSLSLMASLIIKLITGYQQTLSPDHGPMRHLFTYGYCRHSPTCSEYAKTVITERGVVIGLPMSFWRVLRCNPFMKPSKERLLEVAARL